MTRRALPGDSGHDGADRPDAGGFWLLPAHSVGSGVRLTGIVLIRGKGEVVIGDDVVLDAAEAPIELNATTGARLELGRGVRIGPGASIEAGESVSVGPGVIIGAHAKILDNNWHSTVGDRRSIPQSSPVHIGEGARIGARATLVRGAGLGAGSVLLADSVLSRRVPAGLIVGGVPARPVTGMSREQAWAQTDPEAARAAAQALGAAEGARPGPTGRPTMLWLSLLEWVRRMGLPLAVRRVLARTERASTWIIARHQLRSAQELGRCYAFGPLAVTNRGHLSAGDRTIFRGGPMRTTLEVGSGARLEIGDRTMVNYGVHVRADQDVRIGSGCLFGSRITILDRWGDQSGPVVIEDEVWLAHGVTVLPGVRIGRGAAVSAGVVVDRDVPPDCLAVGAPMRVQSLAVLSRAT